MSATAAQDPACGEVNRPGFLQPAFDVGSSGAGGYGGSSSSSAAAPRQRPPRLPGGAASGAVAGSSDRDLPADHAAFPGDRATPSPPPGALVPEKPQGPAPLSARGMSPRRRQFASPTPPPGGASPMPPPGGGGGGGGTSSSRPASASRGGSRCGSSAGAPSSAGSVGMGQLGSSPSRTGSKEEMMDKGYLPSEDYSGIMMLNRELRESHKNLRAELVSLRVEQERLRMEEAFLRNSVLQAGLTPPAEVPPAEDSTGLPVSPKKG
eukprot:TRINITY_DN19108_c0_g1_i1.p1 TRINITY_DN19108_c0_g1~~TRINITY_DN19108_c0_g1_i1.p1  ORF type:complete len:265 (+),score=54.15 TRINITY_DN19108_c0_g1_i1:130-924(+)